MKPSEHANYQSQLIKMFLVVISGSYAQLKLYPEKPEASD
jgi:hypothetical protein